MESTLLGRGYHADRTLALLLRDLPWQGLPEHAKQLVRRCIGTEEDTNRQAKHGTSIDRVEDSETRDACVRSNLAPPVADAGDNDSTCDEAGSYRAWLHTACCDATPATVAVHSGLTCDLALHGGRLALYRQRTLLVIGGRSAGTPSPNPGMPRRPPTGQPNPWASGRSSGATPLEIPSNTSFPSEVMDFSCFHDGGTELRPLRSAVRLLQVPGSDHFDADVRCGDGGGGVSKRLDGSPLPSLEGCALCVYGGCVLVHGGASPEGIANNDLRALAMRPDAARPGGGEYALAGRVMVHQLGLGGEDGCGGEDGGAVGGPMAVRRNWWEPVVLGPAGLAAAGPAAAAAATATGPAGGGDNMEIWAGNGGAGVVGAALPQQQQRQGPQELGVSRPCPPPSARHGHHLAVDSRTCRLWMFGGRTGGSSNSGGAWAYGTVAEDEPRPADSQPCCYWAQMPAAGGGGVGGAKHDGMAAGTAAASTSVGSGGWRDDVFVGGDEVVNQVRWWRLPLQPAGTAPSDGGSSGGGGGGVGSGGPGPSALPNPLHTAATRVHDGSLYVLSSGRAGVRNAGGGGGSGGSSSSRGASQRPAGLCWLLHRVDLATGCCQLLTEPTTSNTTRDSSAAAQANNQRLSMAPVYDDDASVMSDDVLPYFYVYGNHQGGGGAAALGGGCFVPSLHRLDLRAAAAAAAGGSGGEVAARGGGGFVAGGGGGTSWWADVAVTGNTRLHSMRGAMGVASGGSVALVGGVRDTRSGVEARVQLALPQVAPPSAAAARGGGGGPVATAHDELAAARCRRIIGERLRTVAPQEVRFAHPGQDGSGGDRAGRKPCALAAALALYSRGSLFDDFFLDTLDEDGDGADEEEFTLSPRGTKRRAASGAGGGGRGMTLPGHEPLAVAAAVAWVMGRSAVRQEWDVGFVAQLHDLGRCWEVVSLQRECVRQVARRGAGLPLPQLPAALALWDEVRRAGGAAGREDGGGGDYSGAHGEEERGVPGPSAMHKLQKAWRRRLERAATSGEVTAGNMSEVMAAARAAAEVAAAYATNSSTADEDGDCSNDCSRAGSGSGPLQELQDTCVRVAEELLRGGGGGRGGDVPDAQAGRTVMLFACRFQVLPLLYSAMRWWERRLTANVRDGATLPQLVGLLLELRELDVEECRQLQQREQAAARAPLLGTPPAKRVKVAADEQAGPTLPSQLCDWLCEVLRKRTRPPAALSVLQAFSYSCTKANGSAATHPPAGGDRSYDLPPAVLQDLYGKLSVLPPAQLLELPGSFRTPGHSDHTLMAEARRRGAGPGSVGAGQQRHVGVSTPAPAGDASAAAAFERTSGGGEASSVLVRQYGEWLRKPEERARQQQAGATRGCGGGGD